MSFLKQKINGLVGLLVLSFSLNAQISTDNMVLLKAKEDSLRQWAENISTYSATQDRMISDSTFTKILVRALLTKHSFYYPFDSVLGVSKLYAPDSTFRIFTWNLEYEANYSRQRGAIQMRTRDGSLKLFPLRDVSEFTNAPTDSVRTHQNWIGAVYYNIIKTSFAGKNYYTLFGIDNHNASSTKKWVEVLHFNTKAEPVFGGSFFDYGKGKPVRSRLELNYKKNTRVVADFFPDLDMILVDHLISETGQPELPQTRIPDGDNEGYKWEKGKWVYIEKVFTQILQDGQAPREMPLYGN